MNDDQPAQKPTTGYACWPWSHQWSKWEPRIATFTAHGFAWQTDMKPTTVTRQWQVRSCVRCGKIQQESLAWPEAKGVCRSA